LKQCGSAGRIRTSGRRIRRVLFVYFVIAGMRLGDLRSNFSTDRRRQTVFPLTRRRRVASETSLGIVLIALEGTSKVRIRFSFGGKEEAGRDESIVRRLQPRLAQLFKTQNVGTDMTPSSAELSRRIVLARCAHFETKVLYLLGPLKCEDH